MYKLLFHNGSFKKKVLKYGTPKPRLALASVSLVAFVIVISIIVIMTYYYYDSSGLH